LDQNDPNLFREVFSPLAATIAFFGALGGLVRALVLRVSWRETIRVIAVGMITAFGLGTLSPYVLRFLIGDLPEGLGSTLGVLCASAFLVGMISVALVERFITRTEAEDQPNGPSV
jgi:hypothetical protein